jgi:hypothetical protein
MTDYADALARRALDLPAPAGRRGDTAWWLLTGAQVFASPGAVHGWPTDLDGIEADALAMLAAVAWARGGGGA